jgi:hypothetical protein
VFNGLVVAKVSELLVSSIPRFLRA